MDAGIPKCTMEVVLTFSPCWRKPQHFWAQSEVAKEGFLLYQIPCFSYERWPWGHSWSLSFISFTGPELVHSRMDMFPPIGKKNSLSSSYSWSLMCSTSSGKRSAIELMISEWHWLSSLCKGPGLSLRVGIPLTPLMVLTSWWFFACWRSHQVHGASATAFDRTGQVWCGSP